MELQFKVRCEISNEYLFEYVEEKDEEYKRIIAVSKHKSYMNLTSTIAVPNNTMKALLLNIIDCEFGYNNDTVTISNISTSDDKMVFDVNLKVDFFNYDPDVLCSLIGYNNGTIMKMGVKGGKKLSSNDNTITFNLSPLRSNFTAITFLLKDAFHTSIACGSPMVYRAAPRHALSYVVVTANLKKDSCKELLKILGTKKLESLHDSTTNK